MKLFTTGFVLGAVLSGTFWALASSPSMPSPQGARPDRLWQQDRGAAIQPYLEQRNMTSSTNSPGASIKALIHWDIPADLSGKTEPRFISHGSRA